MIDGNKEIEDGLRGRGFGAAADHFSRLTKEQAHTDKLAPCPFCGDRDHLSTQSVGVLTGDMPERPHRVICVNIDHDTVMGPVAYGLSAAITAWNTRTALLDPPVIDREAIRREAFEEAARIVRVAAMGWSDEDVLGALHQIEKNISALSPTTAPIDQAQGVRDG